MKREILTPECCREDLKAIYRMKVLAMGILSGTFLCLGGFAIYLIAVSVLWKTENPDGILALMVTGLVIIAVAPIAWLLIYPKYKIENMVLEIVEDKLEYSTTEDVYRRVYTRRGYYIRHYVNYYFGFAYFGKCRIYDRPYYSWSDLYSADGVIDLYNRAEAGDTYYIVLDRDAKQKKPLMIYNTKEFVFCPDGTTESPDRTWRDSVNME